jgi:hypothetical protein
MQTQVTRIIDMYETIKGYDEYKDTPHNSMIRWWYNQGMYITGAHKIMFFEWKHKTMVGWWLYSEKAKEIRRTRGRNFVQ